MNDIIQKKEELKMKKTIISVLAAVFFVLVAMQSVHAASTAGYGYQIDVSKTSFQPSTIYAGDMVTIQIELKNRGINSAVTDLKAQLDFGDQFKVIKGSDSIDSINPSATKTIELQFQVKAGTPSGYYSAPLSINYMLGNDLLEQDHLIFVPVSKVEKNLDITISPRVVSPSKPTEIVFTLKNVGNTPVSNISFSWAEASNLVLPLGSDNKRYVNVLPANDDANISYTVAADPNITPGIYPLDITMTFNDVNGVRTQTSQVGLIIGGTTDFEVSAEISSTNQLSISIANIGSNNASAVVVKVPAQKGITVSGGNTSILGSLNKGDYTIASFVLQAATVRQASQFGAQSAGVPPGARNPAFGDSNAPQLGSESTVIVEIGYSDTTGERQTVQKTIPLSRSSSSTSDSTTLTGGFGRQRNSQSSLLPWALLAVFAGGAVAFKKFKAGNKSWKKLAIVLAAVAAMFLGAIFLLASDILAVAGATAVSLLLLVWFFRKGLLVAVVQKVRRSPKKNK